MIYKDGSGWMNFTVRVRVPPRTGGAVADALTGNDDDLVLVAEQAMRERLEQDWPYDATEGDELELALDDSCEDVRSIVRSEDG